MHSLFMHTLNKFFISSLKSRTRDYHFLLEKMLSRKKTTNNSITQILKNNKKYKFCDNVSLVTNIKYNASSK